MTPAPSRGSLDSSPAASGSHTAALGKNPTISQTVLTRSTPMLAGLTGLIGWEVVVVIATGEPLMTPAPSRGSLVSSPAASGSHTAALGKNPTISQTVLTRSTPMLAGLTGLIGWEVVVVIAAGESLMTPAPSRGSLDSSPAASGSHTAALGKSPTISRFIPQRLMPTRDGLAFMIG